MIPPDDGSNFAVVFPLSSNGAAIKIGIIIGLNLLSSILFAISYLFQVAIISPPEPAVLSSIGEVKTIIVNNIHAPRTPGLSAGLRLCWYILVFTSLLLHGVFNETVGVSTRFCAVVRQRPLRLDYIRIGDAYRCRSDLSLRFIPIAIVAILLLMKVGVMTIAYIRCTRRAVDRPRVESLADLMRAISRKNAREGQQGVRPMRPSRILAKSGFAVPSEQSQIRKQVSLMQSESTASYLTAICGVGSSLGVLATATWMLVVWNTDPPTTETRASTVLPIFEIEGFSSTDPVEAYFTTGMAAAAPQVMLALVSLLNLSLLEMFYLNKSWATLAHGTTLSKLRHHFTVWKPRSIPAAGKRGSIAIAILVFFPAIAHAITALGIAQQEVFCESSEYDSDDCSSELNPDTGFDLNMMWTSYKLIVNQAFFLIAGLSIGLISVVALVNVRTKPKQALPPFYGHVKWWQGI